jgi:iron complex transport system substrate-binding protein
MTAKWKTFSTLWLSVNILKKLEKLAFRLRQKPSQLNDRNQFNIKILWTCLRSFNPEALALPKCQFFKSCLPYLLLGCFIIGWWMLAFRPPAVPISYPAALSSQSLALKTSVLLEELSPLQRDALQRALSGHFSLMVEFINQWEQDAQLLAQKGVKGIQRLSKEKYIQAHILGHLLQDSSAGYLRQLNCKMNLDWIRDDNGELIHIEDSFQRFLPQSFVAASFLLSIAKPHEIIALPKGMRYLPQLYTSDMLAQIPNNIDRIHSEKLYLAHPNLAFVAPYSHPPALEVLRNQKIQLYTIKHIDSITDIQEALLKVGHASNHVLEAQLLAIFMEASFLSIDNRLQALNESKNSQIPRRLLYLYYHQNYMLPTSKSLSGQLITRALSHSSHMSCPIPQNQEEWRIPFEQEKILQAQPDYLIISTPYFSNSQPIAHHHDALQQSDAFKSQRIFHVDETIQESPTQYIVLAYFDLFQALAATYCL